MGEEKHTHHPMETPRLVAELHQLLERELDQRLLIAPPAPLPPYLATNPTPTEDQ